MSRKYDINGPKTKYNKKNKSEKEEEKRRKNKKTECHQGETTAVMCRMNVTY